MNVTKTAIPEWLLLVFVHNIDEADFHSTVKDLENELKANGSISIKVLMIIDEFSLNRGSVFKTILKELVPDLKNPNQYRFEDKPHPFQFTDGRAWVELLKFINCVHPSGRIILLTLSHGNAVGLSRQPAPDKPAQLVISKTRHLLVRTTLLNSFFQREKFADFQKVISEVNGVRTSYTSIPLTTATECKKIETLWITELANALKDGFGNRKISIALMANCYMQTFDTGWLLRNQVEYLIAPETAIIAASYNIQALMKTLQATPKIDTEELAKTILPALRKKMDTVYYSDHYKKLGVFTNNLEYYTVLKFFFEKIAYCIATCSETEMQQIKDKRNKYVYNVSADPPHLGSASETVETVDLNHFFSLLPDIFKSNTILRSHVDLLRSVSEMSVICKQIGEGFFEHDDNANEEKKYNMHGISIFLPTVGQSDVTTTTINCAFFGAEVIQQPSRDQDDLGEFVYTSLWDEFIFRFFSAKQ
jgi:hypothetical protein